MYDAVMERKQGRPKIDEAVIASIIQCLETMSKKETAIHFAGTVGKSTVYNIAKKIARSPRKTTGPDTAD